MRPLVPIFAAAIALAGCVGPAVSGLPASVDEATLARILPGMGREQVLGMLGPPHDRMTFPRLGQVSWEYRYVDTWGYRALFFVNFDASGIVVELLTRRIENERPLR